MRSINPGVKLAALIVASLILSVTFNTPVNLAVFVIMLVATLASPGTNRRGLALAMLPFALTAVALFVTGLMYGSGGNAAAAIETDAFGQRTLFASDWTTAAQLASRVLAYGGLGMAFAFTSDAFELVMSLMQQFRLPAKFAYGVLAAYHFFPVVRDEYGEVGLACVRAACAWGRCRRGAWCRCWRMRSSAPSLAMAMESRGFEDEGERRCCRGAAARRDLAFAIGLNAAIVVALVVVR